MVQGRGLDKGEHAGGASAGRREAPPVRVLALGRGRDRRGRGALGRLRRPVRRGSGGCLRLLCSRTPRAAGALRLLNPSPVSPNERGRGRVARGLSSAVTSSTEAAGPPFTSSCLLATCRCRAVPRARGLRTAPAPRVLWTAQTLLAWSGVRVRRAACCPQYKAPAGPLGPPVHVPHGLHGRCPGKPLLQGGASGDTRGLSCQMPTASDSSLASPDAPWRVRIITLLRKARKTLRPARNVIYVKARRPALMEVTRGARRVGVPY